MYKKVLLAILLAIVGASHVAAQRAYVCYTSSNQTVTFYYDREYDSRLADKRFFLPNDETAKPDWYSDNHNEFEDATHVVFDPSFIDAQLPYASSNFIYSKIKSASYWFCGMPNLVSITGMEYLDLSEAEYFHYMFSGCSSLTTIDFSESKLERFGGVSSASGAECMFQNCTNLTTICVSSEPFYGKPGFYENHMFDGCVNLVGGNGTAYDPAHTDKSYCVIDGGPDKPGYLSAKDYVAYSASAKTLTFYHDDMMSSRSGVYKYPIAVYREYSKAVWSDIQENVRKVIFDSSFAHARPNYTDYWFSGMKNLTSIEGLLNLNTSEATSMISMFQNCSSLTSLDLRNFKTQNVTNMEGLFAGCSTLKHLDVSGFDVSQTVFMDDMFSGCKGLTSLDLTSWNTANVTSMARMFLDASNLGVILVGDGWNTSSVTDSRNMFAFCSNLVGGAGTGYDNQLVDSYDKTYAHIDGGTANPGFLTSTSQPVAYTRLTKTATGSTYTLSFQYDNLFAQLDDAMPLQRLLLAPTWYDQRASIDRVVFYSSFADARPVSTYKWFEGMSQLTSIAGIEYLNTSEVTDMTSMFEGCTALTNLNLGGFNTANVLNMNRMFYGCTGLTTIDASELWNTQNVTASNSMFSGCTNLVGGAGTPFYASYVDKTLACIDGGVSAPGYLSYISQNVPYAVYYADSHSLYFKCDGEREAHAGVSGRQSFSLNTGVNNPEWQSIASQVTKVVFDASFAGARPSSTFSWFAGMTNLTSIEGLNNLNTLRVTTMGSMFASCSALSAVDLSGFDTRAVTDMSVMFGGCSNLSSLDLSSFATDGVTSMARMFERCSKLAVLDLSGFNTGAVTQMSYMFNGCSNLETIYIGQGWNTNGITTGTSYQMFTGCSKLKGSLGTTYNSAGTNVAYAHDDGGPSAPGYMTDVSKMAYAVFTTDKGGTLTFYSDGRADERTGDVYTTVNTGDNMPGWYTAHRMEIKHVVIDPSFANARPTSLYYWFSLPMAEDFAGIEYLNTSEVTNMFGVFIGYNLPTLDVSNFDTHNVTTMYGMFFGCGELQTLDLTNFDTHNVTSMESMFMDSRKLTTIYVGSGWSTANVTDSPHVFNGCSSLVGSAGTTYNGIGVSVDYARPDGGRDAPGYLWGLDAYACFTASDATLTFYRDYQRAQRSTMSATYDLNTGSDAPGWQTVRASVEHVCFDPSFADARPTTTVSWFQAMQKLKDISGMNYLNTSEVTKMTDMFSNCNLTTLDLRHFDTRQVTDMKEMFMNCSQLTTIYVSNLWDTTALTYSTSMFSGCSSLVGGEGTAFDSNHVDKAYARIDDGPSGPGYFSRMTEAYAVYTPNNNKLTFYYDLQRESHSAATYLLNEPGQEPGWTSVSGNIRSVVFDDSFADARPTSTYKWFAGMSQLTASGLIGWNLLNTSQVTDMGSMFAGCSALTQLDLTDFVTLDVTSMAGMFAGCSSLTAIYVGPGWSTSAVATSTGMFTGCTALKGGAGTAFDSGHTDKAYACVDGIGGMPGYLSSYGYAYVADDNQSTLYFYYDALRAQREATGMTFDLNTGNALPAWNAMSSQFTHVVIDKSFANARPRSTFKWFAGMSNLVVIQGISAVSSYSYLNTSQVTNMSGMFSGCSKLTSLNLSSFDTGNVTEMGQMFNNCSNLTSLILNFNTSKVETMQSMFAYCSSLTSLDLNTFVTSSLSHASWMFYHCAALEIIYVGSGWSISASANSSDMFTGCDNLVGGAGTPYAYAHRDGAYAHVDGGTGNPGYMTAFASLPYAAFADGTLTFYNDGRSDERASQATIFSVDIVPDQYVRAWYDVRDDIEHVVFDPSYASVSMTTLNRMFYQLKNLEDISGLENLNTSQVTDMQEMFNGCSGLTTLDVSSFDTHNVTNMGSMFAVCSSLASIDLSSFDTQNVTTMGNMFQNCRALQELDLSNFDTHKVTRMSNMFYYCSNLQTIYVGSGWTTSAVTSSNMMFFSCSKLRGEGNTAYSSSNPSDKTYARVDGEGGRGYLSMRRTPYAVFTSEAGGTLTFYNDNQRFSREGAVFDIDIDAPTPSWASINPSVAHVVFTPKFGLLRPHYTSGWFKNMQNLTDIEGLAYGYLHTDEVISMAEMFAGCRKLTSLDISSFVTTNVGDMRQLFEGCSQLTSLDFTYFETPFVTDMRGLFKGCSALTELDLHSFATAEVTDMSEMFASCSGLTTICVSGLWTTDRVSASTNMFQGCNRLVGEAGTAFSSAHTDKEYARPDKPADGQPGYLTTLKEAYALTADEDEPTLITFYYDDQRSLREGQTFDVSYASWPTASITSVVFDPSFAEARPTSTGFWFDSMNNLTSITGMQYLCTDDVENMEYMFASCHSLTSIDLSHFNTANVTSMSNMFYDCTSLTTLDLNSFDVTSVTNAAEMFRNSTNLTTIYAGNWSEQLPDNAYTSYMFEGCSSLVGGAGTTFDAEHIDAAYAHVDGGTSGNPGYFTFKETYSVGDVNKDGKITIADVTALVNIILGKTTTYDERLADVNKDNKVTIADVTALVNVILGK